MVAFSIFQYFQIEEALQNLFSDNAEQFDFVFNRISPFLIASVVILFACLFVFGYLSYRLYLEFGWKIYKKIGADPRKRGFPYFSFGQPLSTGKIFISN